MIEPITESTWGTKITNEIPSVVQFSTPTCAPCKVVENWLIQIDKTINHSSKEFDLYKVNIEQDVDLAIKYQILTTPTVLAFVRGKQHGLPYRTGGMSKLEELVNGAIDEQRRTT